MRELLHIVLSFIGVAALVWLYLRVIMFLDEHSLLFRRRKVPKVEIQTLFHGNTKDEDQI